MNKQWIVLLALMLSVGINIGLLAGRFGQVQTGDVADTESTEGSLSNTGSDDSRMPRRLDRIVRRMANELRLKGEEEQAFLAIQQEFFRHSVTGRGRLKKARRQLRRELAASDPDRERAEYWIQELGTAQADLERAFIVNYFETRLLLEPEQEQKFRRFMARIYRARRDFRDARPPRELSRERPGPGVGGH